MLDNNFTARKAPDRSPTGSYHCCALKRRCTVFVIHAATWPLHLVTLEERFYLLCKEVHSLKWQEVKEPEQGL